MKLRDKALRVLAALLVFVMLCGSLAACSPADTKETDTPKTTEASDAATDAPETEEDKEPVEIVWYRKHYGDQNEDEQKVEDAINAYIEPLINVRVKVIESVGSTALDMALAAGDDIDLFWTSGSQLNGFMTKGAAYDLSDVLPEYPELYNIIPEDIWKASQYHGRNYYVPVYKESAKGFGVSIPTSMVQKYGWDLSTVDSLADLEPMLEDMAADGIAVPFFKHTMMYGSFGYDDFAFIKNFMGVDRDGDTTKIVDITKTDEYKAYLEMMHRWNQNGYISQEEIVKITGDFITNCKAEGQLGFQYWTQVPDGKVNESARNPYEVEVIALTDCYLNTGVANGSTYMVNAKVTDEELEACMKLLQLLYTDQTFADLAAYGIEGEHYNRVDGRVELLADRKYKYPGVWAVTSVTAPSLMVGEAENKVELYEEFNNAAELCCTAGFFFDETAVAAELAAISAVYEEYQRLMDHGFYDPAEYLPIFQERLASAGIDKVIAECQSQYDAWLASK